MILWTIRIAALLYSIALVQIIRGRDARVLWTAGCASYLAHVAAAFQWVYGWSHAIAVRETARQTRELFGLDWGVGIWFNYAFTLVWLGDVLWWWIAPESRERRADWIGKTIHGYMVWMFLNGAVVFPKGAVRWISAAVAVSLFVYWLTARRTAFAQK
ncbi:MAG: hypothetical protein HYX27_21295 [Acidobacteria bacterium]|nr:hypothetical protein [Acidobacteriota bacterium]